MCVKKQKNSMASLPLINYAGIFAGDVSFEAIFHSLQPEIYKFRSIIIESP